MKQYIFLNFYISYDFYIFDVSFRLLFSKVILISDFGQPNLSLFLTETLASAPPVQRFHETFVSRAVKTLGTLTMSLTSVSFRLH